jgi:hypothetical protein
MSFNSPQSRLIVAWFAAVTLFVGFSLASALPLTAGYGLSLFALGFVPPMIVLAVFRREPQHTTDLMAGHGRPRT